VAKVLSEACRLAKSEARGRFPLATPISARTAVRAARTLPSKQESRVRLPGGTPIFLLLGWRSGNADDC
jgi:hypothetical protein